MAKQGLDQPCPPAGGWRVCLIGRVRCSSPVSVTLAVCLCDAGGGAGNVAGRIAGWGFGVGLEAGLGSEAMWGVGLETGVLVRELVVGRTGLI